MRIFRLQPVQEELDDPAWAISWYQGSCYVAARSAEAARRFASCAFTVAVCPGGVPAGCGGLPWSQPRLVVAEELPGVPAESIGPAGSVVATGVLAPALLPSAGTGLPGPEGLRA